MRQQQPLEKKLCIAKQKATNVRKTKKKKKKKSMRKKKKKIERLKKKTMQEKYKIFAIAMKACVE
jgi:hypothetical protein